MEKPVTVQKSSILEFQDAAGRFSQFIRNLPETDLVEKAWGPREVLAHEVYWLESYVSQVRAVIAGRTPEPPAGGFDDLNAQALKASHALPAAALLVRFEAASRWLVKVSQDHDPDQIIFSLKQGSAYRVSLSEYYKGEAGHIRKHQNLLEAQVTRAYRKDVDRLTLSVEAFCRYIEQLPDTALREQAWGHKEVLAHLVYWHEQYVGRIEAIETGKSVEVGSGSVKLRNARAVAASRGVPVQVLLQRFRELNGRLCHYVATLDPQRVVIRGQATWQTLDGIILSTRKHIEGHLKPFHK